MVKEQTPNNPENHYQQPCQGGGGEAGIATKFWEAMLVGVLLFLPSQTHPPQKQDGYEEACADVQKGSECRICRAEKQDACICGVIGWRPQSTQFLSRLTERRCGKIPGIHSLGFITG